jgi:hypothetical protein
MWHGHEHGISIWHGTTFRAIAWCDGVAHYAEGYGIVMLQYCRNTASHGAEADADTTMLACVFIAGVRFRCSALIAEPSAVYVGHRH